MNFPTFLFVFMLIIVCGIPKSRAEHPKYEDCKKASEKYFKASHKISMACHADLKDDKLSLDEQFEKFGCTVKCILKKEGFIDDNEAVSDDLLKKSYKGILIPEFEDKLLAAFMDCKSKFGDKLDKADDKCKSYRDYGLCMQESISHVCHENP